MNQGPGAQGHQEACASQFPRHLIKRLVKELKLAQRLKIGFHMNDQFSSGNNILFAAEARYCPNDHVNKPNCIYWNLTNPKHKHESLPHLLKITILASMSLPDRVDRYFFENGHLEHGDCCFGAICEDEHLLYEILLILIYMQCSSRMEQYLTIVICPFQVLVKYFLKFWYLDQVTKLTWK